jgi:hypothetical protein
MKVNRELLSEEVTRLVQSVDKDVTFFQFTWAEMNDASWSGSMYCTV